MDYYAYNRLGEKENDGNKNGSEEYISPCFVGTGEVQELCFVSWRISYAFKMCKLKKFLL